MTDKKTVPAAVGPAPAHESSSGESDAESARQRDLAGHAIKPSLNAAAILSEYTKAFGQRGMAGFVGALDAQIAALEAGDTSQLEAMLLAQAYSLQAIFMTFARRAVSQQDLKSWDLIMRMAFKAQNQSRMTLETLGAFKNPPVLFARQANVAHGPQQVNNGVSLSVSASPRARKTQKLPNKLLEIPDEERLESRATGAPSRADSDVEALDAVDRTPDPGRQSESLQKRRPRRLS